MDQQHSFDEALLNEYARRPALYNKHMVEHKDRIYKENAWLAIGSVMKSSALACETRIRQLRERYNKEKRDHGKLTVSGAGKVDDPKWPLFKVCSFLDEHIKPRKTVGNFSQIGLADEVQNPPTTYWVEIDNQMVELPIIVEDDSSCSLPAFSTPSPSVTLSSTSPQQLDVSQTQSTSKNCGRGSRNSRRSDGGVTSEMKRLTEIAEKVASRGPVPPPDEDDAFAKLVSLQMSPLPQDIKEDLQYEILGLINKAKRNERQRKGV